MFLAGHTYDVGVMVIFLFQMVFMDTALTIVTGAAAERWKFLHLRRLLGADGRLHLSALCQLGMGRRLAGAVGHQPGTRKGLLRLCRFGRGACGWRTHRTGGCPGHRTAHRQVQPRRISQRHHRPRHLRCPDRLLHSRLRLVRVQPRQHAGCFRSRLPAHRFGRREHHAGRLHRHLRRTALHVDHRRASPMPR